MMMCREDTRPIGQPLCYGGIAAALNSRDSDAFAAQLCPDGCRFHWRDRPGGSFLGTAQKH